MIFDEGMESEIQILQKSNLDPSDFCRDSLKAWPDDSILSRRVALLSCRDKSRWDRSRLKKINLKFSLNSGNVYKNKISDFKTNFKKRFILKSEVDWLA